MGDMNVGRSGGASPVNANYPQVDLSSISDKIGNISENINSLVQRLMDEVNALSDAREQLCDAKSALSAKKAAKPQQPSKATFTNKDGEVDEDGYKAACDKYQSSMNSWNADMSRLENNVKTAEGKVSKCEDDIAKTEHDIQKKERELDSAKGELRRAQSEASSVGSSSSASGASGADDVSLDDLIEKTEDIKSQIKVALDKCHQAAASSVHSQNYGVGQNNGHDFNIGEVSNSVSVNINIEMNLWNNNYAAGFREAKNTGDVQGMQSQFAAFVKDIRANGMPVDVNALVQQVLRESYLDTTEDLKFYADKVKYFNEAKKMTREYVQDLRDFKTQMSKAAQSYSYSYKDGDNTVSKQGFCLSDPPSSNDPSFAAWKTFQEDYFKNNISSKDFGAPDSASAQMAQDLNLPSSIPGDCSTVEDLDNMIKKFEEQLAGIGDDAQLANTDLQNVLQKQQQTLQMMSNISKTLSDTALAVIRKIG